VNLNSLLGHEAVRTQLRAAIAGDRVPHAMLFTGPEGVGKRTAAIALARELVTAGDPEQEARFDRGVHDRFVLYADVEKPLPVRRADLLRITGDEASLREAYTILEEHGWIQGVAAAGGAEVIDLIRRNPERWLGRKGIPFADVVDRELAALEKSRKSSPVAVEVARRLFSAGTSRAWYRKSLGIEMINGKGDGSYFRTVESLLSRSAGEGWRAAVIDDAHAMTDPAENAFLKTLEEPPPRTLLILVTSQPLSLLSTTLSRCARMVFDAVPSGELVNFLVQTQDMEEADAAALTTLAEGSPGRALELRGIDFAGRLRFLEELLPAVAAGDLARCLALGGGRVTAPPADTAGVRDAQRREARLLLELLALAFRDLAIFGAVPGVRLVSGLSPERVADLAARQPGPVWEGLFERAEVALSDVNASVEPRLAVEALFADALPLGRVA